MLPNYLKSMSEICLFLLHRLNSHHLSPIVMNASENFKYIASLGECPSAFKEDSAKIKALRESIVDQNTLSKEQVECCLDILDSATILTDMLFPFQAAVGLITKYRGVELFNFNQIFNCEPISSLDLYKFLIRLSETNRRSIINTCR